MWWPKEEVIDIGREARKRGAIQRRNRLLGFHLLILTLDKLILECKEQLSKCQLQSHQGENNN
ncbi:hypothetical protein J6590_079823 [Homalodisca vitripennis]|nr:hypothetical protein J6590_079823 [Homalodisca vitripennis]